ncbi:PIN-like domain-containing protein, partial [Lactococcus lactis]|uniref:PIN-like domain-containing protein n=1 Tax=Lactococcus lactis TaxID=1358 RepID=UPI0025A25557
MNSELSLLDVVNKDDSIFDNLNNGKKTLYVLDTNVLLAPLKVMGTSNFFIKALKNDFFDIYIPIMSYMEFILNHKDIIKQTEKYVNEGYNMLGKKNIIESSIIKKDDLQNLFLEKFKTKKSKIGNQSHYQKYIEKEAKKIFDLILEAIDEDLKKVNSHIEHSLLKVKDNDKYSLEIYNQEVKEYIKELKKYFNSNTQYVELYPVEKFEILKREAQERLDNKLGPGYQDISNKKGKTKRISELEWDSSLGDAILWLESIEYSLSVKKEYELIVIVSDDNKEDWSEEKGTSDLKDSLAIEFFQKTGLPVKKISSSQYIIDINSIAEKFNNPKNELELKDYDLKKYEDELRGFDLAKHEAEMEAEHQAYWEAYLKAEHEAKHEAEMEAEHQAYWEAYLEAEHEAKHEAEMEAEHQAYWEAYLEA